MEQLEPCDIESEIEPQPAPPPGPSGGEMLRTARQARELTIDQVASALRLPPRQIKALEEEDFNVLPEPTYVCGYIRAYAKFLQLASNDVVDAYPNLETLRADRVPVVESRITSADLPSGRPDVPVSLVVLLVMLVAVSTWYFSGNTDQLVVAVSPESPAEPEPVSVTPTAALETPQVITRLPETAPPLEVIPQAEQALDTASLAEPTDEVIEIVESPIPNDAVIGISEAAVITADSATTEDKPVSKLPADPVVATQDSRKTEDVKPVKPPVPEIPEQVVKSAPVPAPVIRKPAAAAAPAAPAGKIRRVPPPVVQPQDITDTIKSEMTAIEDQSAVAKDLIPASRLIVSYTEDSWTDISDARGYKLIYKLGRGGSKITVSGVAPFRVFLGYAPGVSIILNGESVDMSPYQNMTKVTIKVGSKSANNMASAVDVNEHAPQAGPPDSAREQARQALRESVSDDAKGEITAAADSMGAQKTGKRSLDNDDFDVQMTPPIREKSKPRNDGDPRPRKGPAPITNLFD